MRSGAQLQPEVVERSTYTVPMLLHAVVYIDSGYFEDGYYATACSSHFNLLESDMRGGVPTCIRCWAAVFA